LGNIKIVPICPQISIIGIFSECPEFWAEMKKIDLSNMPKIIRHHKNPQTAQNILSILEKKFPGISLDYQKQLATWAEYL
jgi:hypothetical protein